MFGFRKSSGWRPVAALLLLGACGGGGDDIVYNIPVCWSSGRLTDNTVSMEIRTATLVINKYDTGVHYTSDSGPGFNYRAEWRVECPETPELRVPPGVYELKAVMAVRKYGLQLPWQPFPVEFQPHATYRLTSIWLEPIDAPPENWPEKTVPFPLVMRRHDLPGNTGFFEVAVAGPHGWNTGLTEKQIRKGLELMQAGIYTQDQLQAMHAAWLAENEQKIAETKPVAVDGFVYEGHYILTRGNSCAENLPLSRQRFMEISRDPEKGALEYYVSFGGFLYDDANSVTWPEKVGLDGSLLSVIEDPKPATGGSLLQGPMTIRHRITLKPRDAEHLMITEWTRTTVDPSGIYEPKTVDMRTYNDNWDKNPYFIYVSGDGYCLKRVGEISG